MRLSDEDLRRRVVISGDGVALGEIAHVFLNSSDLHVEALQVKLRRKVALDRRNPRQVQRGHDRDPDADDPVGRRCGDPRSPCQSASLGKRSATELTCARAPTAAGFR